MDQITRQLNQQLERRKQANSYRSLLITEGLTDFCSNDYLGFASSDKLNSMIFSPANTHLLQRTGSTGSRLISGNHFLTEQLENDIANFHNAESALLFNSGYDANLGLFSCIANRGDTIITDELAHASIIDGARLSHATRYSFKHNDLQHLEAKIKISKGNIFIAVESIYSMDGDEAPLEDLVELAERYGAALIVDEAHAAGIFGHQGRGLVNHYNLQGRIFARIITFGKAFGCHGAAVVGSVILKNYLINYARSFIYSTAAPPHNHLAVSMAYQLLQQEDYQSKIIETITFFKEKAMSISRKFIKSGSPIQSYLVPGNREARDLAQHLSEEGFAVKPILSPTVQQGSERIRICLHSFNTNEEIRRLINLLKKQS